MNILDTITNNTNLHINELLSTIVLPQIIVYCNEKYKLDLTIQELENVLLLNQAKYEPIINKKRKKHVLNKEGRHCSWEFKRGDLKGTHCTKTAIENSKYCSSCSKRDVIVATEKNNKNNVVKNLSIENMPKSLEGNVKLINVYLFDAEKGHFKDRNHGFIFKKNENDVIYIIGKVEGLNDTIQTLTEEDIVIAKELNYPISQ